MKEPVALPIVESSQAGEARRLAIALADRLGFNETERGKVSLVVTEVANNLVHYAQDGLLLLQVVEQQNIPGLEILALDKGPGMSDISKCLQDGFSTGGTSGNGLGAIARLSAVFDIYSLANGGTALLSRLWASPLPPQPRDRQLEMGALCLPMTGEEISGDAWAIEEQAGRTLLLVADGLGHGPLAAQASSVAVKMLRENADQGPVEIMEAAHAALRSTRGAALAIAEINFEQQMVRFAGVGNISGCIFSADGSQSLVSYNGTVGHEVRKIRDFTYQWSPGSLLVMYSDGLATQWRWERYPGLVVKHPSLIAGVLYRDFNRSRDDVTVLVAREN